MMRFRTLPRPLETTGSSGTGKYCNTLKHFTCKCTQMLSRLSTLPVCKSRTVKSHKSYVDILNTVVCCVMSHVVCRSQTVSAVLLFKLGIGPVARGKLCRSRCSQETLLCS